MSASYIKGELSEILELSKLKPTLIKILKDVMELWPVDTIEITSAIRTEAEDKAIGGSGVHVLGRALDIRTVTLPGGHSSIYPIAEQINKLWSYDFTRPYKSVAFAELHGTGFHLHLQVHDKTVKRNGESNGKLPT